MKQLRKVEVAILSDVLLGSTGCPAEKLIHYLESIQPKLLIFSGQFFDPRIHKQPESESRQSQVLSRLVELAHGGTEISFVGVKNAGWYTSLLGIQKNIRLQNYVGLNFKGTKALILPEDIFQTSGLLAQIILKMGDRGFSLFRRCRRLQHSLNTILKKSSNSGTAERYENKFARKASKYAIKHAYDVIICCNSKTPKILPLETEFGKTLYINPGSWNKDVSALEFQFKRWKIHSGNQRAGPIKSIKNTAPTTDTKTDTLALGLV